MGQQQLLLIVLSAIIVGIAIVVGINLVTTSAGQANFDAVMQDLITLGERAREWYRKPALSGGGGNSFAALTNDAAMNSLLGWPSSNENGTYSVQTAGSATSVTFQGIGVEDLDANGTLLNISVTAYRDSLVTTINDR
ncbi:MAG: hypothetical protein ACE5HS_01350 [bacterium]